MENYFFTSDILVWIQNIELIFGQFCIFAPHNYVLFVIESKTLTYNYHSDTDWFDWLAFKTGTLQFHTQ